jgi:hypothetical protein
MKPFMTIIITRTVIAKIFIVSHFDPSQILVRKAGAYRNEAP